MIFFKFRPKISVKISGFFNCSKFHFLKILLSWRRPGIFPPIFLPFSMNIRRWHEYFRTNILIFRIISTSKIRLTFTFCHICSRPERKGVFAIFYILLHFAGMILNSPHANWKLLLTVKLFSSVLELFAIEFKSLKLLWLGLIWRKKFCNSVVQ